MVWHPWLRDVGALALDPVARCCLPSVVHHLPTITCGLGDELVRHLHQWVEAPS